MRPKRTAIRGTLRCHYQCLPIPLCSIVNSCRIVDLKITPVVWNNATHHTAIEDVRTFKRFCRWTWRLLNKRLTEAQCLVSIMPSPDTLQKCYTVQVAGIHPETSIAIHAPWYHLLRISACFSVAGTIHSTYISRRNTHVVCNMRCFLAYFP